MCAVGRWRGGACCHSRDTGSRQGGSPPSPWPPCVSERTLVNVKTFCPVHLSICVEGRRGQRDRWLHLRSSPAAQGHAWWHRAGLGEQELCTPQCPRIPALNRHLKLPKRCHARLSTQGSPFLLLPSEGSRCVTRKNPLWSLGQIPGPTPAPNPGSGPRCEARGRRGHPVQASI